MTLRVSAIQHGSVGDGDGIRTTVFLKGCNLRCPWCHNPETQSAEPVTLRYSTRTVVNGTEMDVEAIVTEALEDFDFYGEDGGVTVSGGEPLLQSEGVAELIRRLAKAGVRTVLDTAGCVPYAAFEHLGDAVDTYFFDLKAADAEGYRAVGGDFERVRSNLACLIAEGRHVRVRIPLIPGFNDSPAYSRRMCDVLRSVGATEVDLLPFHRLGSGKYEAMGLTYAYREQSPMSVAHAETIADTYREHFCVRVEK